MYGARCSGYKRTSSVSMRGRDSCKDPVLSGGAPVQREGLSGRDLCKDPVLS